MVELLGLPKIKFYDGTLFLDKDLMVQIACAFQNAPCTVSLHVHIHQLTASPPICICIHYLFTPFAPPPNPYHIDPHPSTSRLVRIRFPSVVETTLTCSLIVFHASSPHLTMSLFSMVISFVTSLSPSTSCSYCVSPSSECQISINKKAAPRPNT